VVDVLSYIVRRILYSVPVLLVASFVLFVGVRITFDPAAKLAFSQDPDAISRYKKSFGLDQPIVIQYIRWIGNFVRGDWGKSSRTSGDVFPMMTRSFGFTLQLIIWGVLVSAVLAIAVGVYSAVRQYSVTDYLFTGISYVGIALPPFWFGLVAIQFFVFTLAEWFNLDSKLFYFVGLHSTGQSGINLDYFRHLLLPVMTLTVQIIASWSRYERAAMLDVLGSDYVRTARAKGVPQRQVVFKHAFRNALIPLLTVIAIDAGLLFGGLVVTERIFSIPGMGRLFLDSLQTGDAYVLMAWFVVTAFFVILFNLIADLLYAVFDPRIRLA
jgi:peptide/nickel transport system permease protein